jgi:hypothetical protein
MNLYQTRLAYILQSENQQLCRLIMISIPDHLVTLSKGVTTSSGQAEISSELNENER